jgi:hypothetical protein
MSRPGRNAEPPGAVSLAARALSMGLAVLLFAAGVAGCGSPSGTAGAVVVRVGDVSISRSRVDHWTGAVQRSSSVGTALGPTSGTPRERALDFLISSSWVLGEATAKGLSISNAAVEHGLQEKIDALPNGRSEFDEELSSTGQTPADVKLEVKSSLAVSMLRNVVAKRVPAVSPIEVASCYAHHRRSFRLPDRRSVDLIEEIRSYARAIALGKRLGPGAPFAKRAIRELVRRETPAEIANRSNGQLIHAIFAATPGRVAGPAMFFGHWVLAVVRKLIPAGIQPLSAVRGELSKTLTLERRNRALSQFAAAFVRKWTARTSCSPGYVVAKCSEYRGAHAGERNPLTGG